MCPLLDIDVTIKADSLSALFKAGRRSGLSLRSFYQYDKDGTGHPSAFIADRHACLSDADFYKKEESSMSKQEDDYCRMCGGCGLSKYNRFEEAEEARRRKADAEAAAFLQEHPNASEAEYAAFARKRALELADTGAKDRTSSMPDELSLSRSVDASEQTDKEGTPIYAVLIGLLLALAIGALAGSFLTGHVKERAFSDSSQTAVFSETEL